jgi:hypothetical protein
MKAQLRVHPKLKYQGARTWPPDWSGGYNGGGIFPHGEEGTLEDVAVVERDLIGPERLELANEYKGRKLSGLVWLDEPELVPKLRDILKQHIGAPMRNISELEVDL